MVCGWEVSAKLDCSFLETLGYAFSGNSDSGLRKNKNREPGEQKAADRKLYASSLCENKPYLRTKINAQTQSTEISRKEKNRGLSPIKGPEQA